MKNIAFYLESTEGTGGVNRVVSIIASRLAERGYNIHIISRFEGKHGRFLDDAPGVTLHELFKKFHSKYATSFLEAVRLRQLVRRNNIDILVSTGGIFFALARFSKTRHIVWDHVGFWHGNKLQRYLRRSAARKAEALVTLTQESRRAVETVKGARARVETIHNPAAVKTSRRIDPASKKIVSLGFLGREKGYDLLVEAWASIDPALRDGWEVLIAGDDRGERPALERLIERNDIKNIRLLGFRSDVAELLSASSIYVMSSRSEGMPMVLLEAQAFGLPVVSFDCRTGPSEIVTPGCGVLVEPENPEALGKALAAMMRDEAGRAKLSAGALENVKRFSLEGIVEQWIRLFERR